LNQTACLNRRHIVRQSDAALGTAVGQLVKAMSTEQGGRHSLLVTI
jgi:hypothetical protein